MCTEKVTGTWPQVVKKTVDDVYNYLIQHPDGITMVATDYGKRGSRICSKLVSRGIIEKQMLGRGKGCRYKWIATMGPTKVLYGSIAQELYDEERKYKDTFKKKGKPTKNDGDIAELADSIAKEETKFKKAPVVTSIVTKTDAPLLQFSAQELWDELKSRGYFIQENRLAIVKTAYLD